MRTRVIVACIALILDLSIIGRGQTQPSGTSVAILVDISKSFAPLGPEDAAALDAVMDAIGMLAREGWTPPVSVTVGLIGTSSVFSKAPCGVVSFQPRLVVRKNELNRAEDFIRVLDECSKGIVQYSRRASAIEQYTDISGAVMLASQRMRQAQDAKVIIVLSDLVEDHPADFQPVGMRLNGERIVLLYRPESGDRQKPSRLFDRVSKWEGDLKAAGAAVVCSEPISGLTRDTLKPCLGAGR